VESRIIREQVDRSEPFQSAMTVVIYRLATDLHKQAAAY